MNAGLERLQVGVAGAEGGGGHRARGSVARPGLDPIQGAHRAPSSSVLLPAFAAERPGACETSTRPLRAVSTRACSLLGRSRPIGDGTTFEGVWPPLMTAPSLPFAAR